MKIKKYVLLLSAISFLNFNVFAEKENVVSDNSAKIKTNSDIKKDVEKKENLKEDPKKKLEGKDSKGGADVNGLQQQPLDKNLEKPKIPKKFKKEDYEYKGFDLKVYDVENTNKNEVVCKVLIYVHKKTGAIFVYFPIEEKDKHILNNCIDKICFPDYITDFSGANHVLEHLLKLVRNGNKFKFADHNSNASTFSSEINLELKSITRSPESFKNEILHPLIKPDILNKNIDPALKQKETYYPAKIKGRYYDAGRVFQEVTKIHSKLKREAETSCVDKSSIDNVLKIDIPRRSIVPGFPKELKKLKWEDVGKKYRKIFHPSNSTIFLHGLYQPEEVKTYLKLMSSWYDLYDKKEYDHTKNREKQKKLISDISLKDITLNVYKESDFVKFVDFKKKDLNKNEFYKYRSIFIYTYKLKSDDFIKDFIIKDLGEDVIDENLKELIKKQGYDHVRIHVKHNEFIFNFYGNKKENFEKSVVEKNSKILLKKLFEKIRKSPESEYHKYFISYEKAKEEKKNKIEIPQDQKIETSICCVENGIMDSKKHYNKILDRKEVEFDGNKIYLDETRLGKNIKNNLDKLDLLEKAINSNKTKKNYELYIQTDKISPIPKDKEEKRKFIRKRNLKFYLENLNNKDMKKERFIKCLLNDWLYYYLNHVCCYTYCMSQIKPINGTRGLHFLDPSDSEKKLLKEYFKKCFDDDIKKFELDEKQYLEVAKDYLDILIKTNKDIEDFMKRREQDLIKLDKIDTKTYCLNENGLRKIRSLFHEMSHLVNDTLWFNSKKEMNSVMTNRRKFISTIEKYAANVNSKATDGKAKKEASKNIIRKLQSMFETLKEFIQNTIKFNNECIKELTDEKGNIKPYDKKQIEELIRSVRYAGYNDYNGDKHKIKEKKMKKFQKKNKIRDRNLKKIN